MKNWNADKKPLISGSLIFDRTEMETVFSFVLHSNSAIPIEKDKLIIWLSMQLAS